MDKLIHILHLEDDAADAELVQAMLESSGMACQINCVQTRDEFSESLSKGGYDVILADYALPMYDGMSALRLVKELQLDVPFIFVSGTMGEDAAIAGLTEGATDYVLKQKLSRLAAAVKRALNEVENQRERKRAEEELRRVNRALRVLNETNQTLIRITEEATLLNEICRIAVDVGGYRLAWVGFAEHDEAKTLRPVAHAGFASGYIESANVSWADNERGRGPGGIAIRTGQPCMARNIPVNPAFAPWREAAIQRGYKSIIALPLISEGQTLGALGIYAGEADAFDAKEVETLEELAGDLAFGITALRTRARRDQAEEALRHSEKEKTILNEIANILLTIPDDEIYGEVQDVVLRVMKSKYGIFGFIDEQGNMVIPSLTRAIWSECQVPGKSIIFPPDSWRDSLWGKAIREKKTFSADGPFHTPEGHVRIDHFLVVPIVYGQESIGQLSVANKEGGYTNEDKDLLERIAGYVSPILNARLQRDMQERHRRVAVEALRESEKRYRRITETITDYVYTVHFKDGKAMETSHGAGCTAVTGYTSEEFAADPYLWIRIVAAEDRKAVEDHFLRVLAGEEAAPIEHRIIRKDGLERWVRNTSVTRPSESGRLQVYDGLIQDITERKQAERSLAESEGRLRTLVQTIPDLIWLKDADGVYLACNTRFERFFGAKETDIVGKTDYDFVDKELADFFREYDRKAMAAGKPSANEEWLTFADDGYRGLFDTIKTPLYDAEGKLIGVLGIARDITERKRAEEEKEKLMSQLVQAQKMEAIGTLAGGIAHDFNNILGALIGYTELAIGESQEETKQCHLEQVLKASDRAKDLVKQILSFARQTDQERKPVEVSIICKEALKLLRSSLPTTIEIRRNITSARTTVLADPTQIHQILMNLCTNAAHAMREKGGLMTVCLANVNIFPDTLPIIPHLQAGPYVQMIVSDTGHGIDPAIMERIFDPFFTTKDVGEGTGLGLAVVYGIVNNLGGTITVQSEPGEGAAFNVYLPLIDKGMPREAKKISQVLPTGTERILVVDDEESLMKIMKKMLQSLGYDVVATSSSEEALKLFLEKPERFDMVITDMTMPHMTGVELAKKLMEMRPGLPIILSTGFSESISEDKVLGAGFRKLLMKPVSKTDLALSVREVMDDVTDRSP